MAAGQKTNGYAAPSAGTERTGVADKVVRGSEVPVVLVPVSGVASAIEQRTIMVALDGSKEAEKGLQLAREIAARAQWGVTLRRAYDTAPPVYVDFTFYPADFASGSEEVARGYLEGVALPGETTLVAQGRPDAAIETPPRPWTPG